jgi:shikimate dehydrogenase
MEVYHLGLIGWPLKRSLSPVMHEAALKSLELEGDYRCFPVEPLPSGEEPLETLLDRMRRGELHGLNVTVPHKEAIILALDRLTTTAERIGAVNSIFVEGHALIGDNTDRDGFLADLDAELAPETGHALILGAGGAARAVVDGLSERGWKISVAARRVSQAQQLAESLNRAGHPPILPITLAFEYLMSVPSDVKIIVNATSLGMAPEIQGSPWPEGVPFPEQAVVYDLVYTPRETRLTRQARKQGLRAVTGLGMLVEQAALSFECWTGLDVPRAVMRQAGEQAAQAWEQMGGN